MLNFLKINYWWFVIFALFPLDYLVVKYGIKKRVMTVKDHLGYSLTFTFSYVVIMIVNLLFVFRKINGLVYGNEMNWFDSFTTPIFFITNYVILILMYKLFINKLFKISKMEEFVVNSIMNVVNATIIIFASHYDISFGMSNY